MPLNIFKNKKCTNVKFAARVSALAAGLRKIKVGRGDRIATVLYNCVECFEVFFAACKIGAIYVPLNYRLSSNEIAYVLNDSGASVLISEEEFIPLIESIRAKTSIKEYLLIADNCKEGWKNYENIVEENYGIDFSY